MCLGLQGVFPFIHKFPSESQTIHPKKMCIIFNIDKYGDAMDTGCWGAFKVGH